MSAFVIGVPVPEGLDSTLYRVRVVVDRIDGAALTGADLAQLEAVYPSKPAKPLRARTKAPAGGGSKPERKSSKTRRASRLTALLPSVRSKVSARLSKVGAGWSKVRGRLLPP